MIAYLLAALSVAHAGDCAPVDLERLIKDGPGLLARDQNEELEQRFLEAEASLTCLESFASPKVLAQLYQLGGKVAWDRTEQATAETRWAQAVVFEPLEPYASTAFGPSAQGDYEAVQARLVAAGSVRATPTRQGRLDGHAHLACEALMVLPGRHLAQWVLPEGTLSSAFYTVTAGSDGILVGPGDCGVAPPPGPEKVRTSPRRPVWLVAGSALLLSGGAYAISRGADDSYVAGTHLDFEGRFRMANLWTWGGVGALAVGSVGLGAWTVGLDVSSTPGIRLGGTF